MTCHTRHKRTPETFDHDPPNHRYTHRAVGKCTYDSENFYQYPVGVFRRRYDPAGILTGDDVWEQIGSYIRNFSDMGPFYAFTQDGKDYALYSPDYTLTRVMSLPDCKDIAGEVDPENNGCGYCPLEFYAPRTPDWHPDFRFRDAPYEDRVNGQFAVVSGCYWGAESFNPIYYLDLSRITEGLFSRDDRFGTLCHHHNITLEESIGVFDYTAAHPVVDVANKVECDTRLDYDLDCDAEATKLLTKLAALGYVADPEATPAAVKLLSDAVYKYMYRPIRNIEGT